MIIWIDAQLSPDLAPWIENNLGIKSIAVRDLGLREAKDIEIFRAARDEDAVVLTKDADFPHLLSQHGPPPRVLWLTCGNTSNENLQRILRSVFPEALTQWGEEQLESGTAKGATLNPVIDEIIADLPEDQRELIVQHFFPQSLPGRTGRRIQCEPTGNLETPEQDSSDNTRERAQERYSCACHGARHVPHPISCRR